MAVKEAIGRRRYIVFVISEGTDITWKDLTYTFNRSLPAHQDDMSSIDHCQEKYEDQHKIEPKKLNSDKQNGNGMPVLRHRLKQFDGRCGILLCPHWMQRVAIKILNSIEKVGILNKPVKIESIGTSGTLKSAMKKYIH